MIIGLRGKGRGGATEAGCLRMFKSLSSLSLRSLALRPLSSGLWMGRSLCLRGIYCNVAAAVWACGLAQCETWFLQEFEDFK